MAQRCVRHSPQRKYDQKYQEENRWVRLGIKAKGRLSDAKKIEVTLYGISPTKRGMLSWACALHLSL